jgi:preprotein translocase subunit YajC
LGLLALVFAGPVTAEDGESSEPAAAADGEAAGEGNGEAGEAPSLSSMAVPIIGMGLIFYFIVLRPQKKAKKKQEALVESLKKHDRVVTIGGIVGTIISFDTDNDEVVLEVGPDTQLRLLRRSIQGPKPFGDDADSDSGR